MGYTFDNVHYPKITGLLSDMTCVTKWSRTTHRFGDSLGGPARLGM